MNRLLMLLAENPIQQRMEGLRDGFNTSQSVADDFRGFLLFIAGVVAIVLVLFVWSRRRQRQAIPEKKSHALRFFDRSLKELGIGISDRLLLLLLAWRSKIPHPTALLLSPELLSTQLEPAASILKFGALIRYARNRIDALATAAFKTE